MRGDKNIKRRLLLLGGERARVYVFGMRPQHVDQKGNQKGRPNLTKVAMATQRGKLARKGNPSSSWALFVFQL